MIRVMDWPTLQKKTQAKSGGAAGGGRQPASRVRQLAMAGGLVVALTVGAGAWFFSSQDRGPVGVVDSQQTLASTAITTARDVGAFLRENVTRDLASIASLLNRSGEESPEGADAEEALADVGLGAAEEVGASRTLGRRWREPTPPPELHAGIGPMPWAEVPREAPLFMVFDESHADVTPPGAGDIRLRSEFLPASMFQSDAHQESEAEGETHSDFEQVGLVEVIVSEMGEVEHAKLLSAPQNVLESMLLSAIKAWQFTPAVKDGMAVRYRQVMPITVAR